MVDSTAERTQKYRRIALLGEGGMARVFLALANGPAGFNKLFVVKELRGELMNDPASLRMFLDEARLSAQLNHANIVQTMEVVSEGDQKYIVMEYLEGKPLSRILSRIGRDKFPLDLHLFVIREVLRGLHYAHEYRDYSGKLLDVVHRDISPDNVFVTYDGRVKLLDFGIAKSLGREEQTALGVFKGKISYAAPEQILGAKLDRRVDVFAMGVILWEALTARRLARVSSKDVNDNFELIQRRVTATEARVLDVRPDAPHDLVSICERAMANAPADRFPTAVEFERALEQHAIDSGSKVADRELGALISSVFQAERNEIRGLVEAKIASVDRTSESIPSLNLSSKSSPSISETNSPQAGFATTVAVTTEAPRRRLWLGALALVAVLSIGILLAVPSTSPGSSPSVSGSRPTASAPSPPNSEEPASVAAASNGAHPALPPPTQSVSAASTQGSNVAPISVRKSATSQGRVAPSANGSAHRPASKPTASGPPSNTGEVYEPQPLDDRK